MLTCCEKCPLPSAVIVALAVLLWLPPAPSSAPMRPPTVFARAVLVPTWMVTRAPGDVRPDTVNCWPTVVPFAGWTLTIWPADAVDVPDVKAHVRLKGPPLLSVPETRTRCAPGVSGESGTKRKPRGERVDWLVISVPSSVTRTVLGSTVPPANVAPIVGRRDVTVAPRAGCSLASVIAPPPPCLFAAGTGVIVWFGGTYAAPLVLIATTRFAPS